MQLIFRPEAEEELLEAQAWYEARANGLGFEFARAVDAAVESLLFMPFGYPCIEDKFRQISYADSHIHLYTCLLILRFWLYPAFIIDVNHAPGLHGPAVNECLPCI